MNITILAVGKVKESFYREALSEYQKRLSRYCRLEIVEVVDESVPEKASPAEEELIKEREAKRILKRLRENSFVITLEITGKKIGFGEVCKKAGRSRSCGEKPACFCDRRFSRAACFGIRTGGFKTQFFRSDVSPSADAGNSGGADLSGVSDHFGFPVP